MRLRRKFHGSSSEVKIGTKVRLRTSGITGRVIDAPEKDYAGCDRVTVKSDVDERTWWCKIESLEVILDGTSKTKAGGKGES